MTAVRLLLAAVLTLPGAAGAAVPERLPVPSGAEVWLQEVRTDRVPAMGLVRRYRFVMPSLDALVPAVAPEDLLPDDLPLDVPLDDEGGDDAGLSAEDQAALDEGLGGLAIESLPGDAPAPDGGEPDTSEAAPLPDELSPPDDASAGAPPDEAAGDLAASDGEMSLPAAPDILMQDPAHRDIEWLCQNVALPDAVRQVPRPTQIVISLASAESDFGTFDPNVVQLFEGFALPRDRDACVWEPI